ncbi:nucleotide disphospho-sugar-binding domain-containing protein [Kitasatospora sp. NPDC058190]|uniref:nucleotide disphospho-sugar-binding domain-containing protein n=1 Tax=Kitasatospora sp. NPDC058190 TaxID=3346371 RepID=UPI0036D85E73
MRVMFAVSDYLPHYFPMVPLGWALQAAGHEVRVVCGTAQQSHVEGAGLSPVPVLEDVNMLMWARLGLHQAVRAGTAPAELELPLVHPETGAELGHPDEFDVDAFIRSIRGPEAGKAGRRINAMVDFARDWRPDLVLHDLLHLDGVVPARVLGVPALCHLTGPIGTEETGWGLDFVPQHYSREFERHGITATGRALIDRVIDICPADLAPPTAAERLPLRYVPYNGPGGMDPWMARPAERPRVVVMWSNTLPHLYGARSFAVPMILDALAGLDVDVVLTMNAAGLAKTGPLPSNVTVVEHCPLHLLMATADLLVHSGGAGGLLTATAHGLPQLVVAFGAEYRANGERIEAAGGGRLLSGPRTDAEELRRSVRALLEDPSHRRGAEKLRDQNLDRPSPADLVETLERIAAGPEGAAR